MTICMSTYQNHDPQGNPLGESMRCQRRGEHAGTADDLDMHQARTRIGLTRWPSYAAMPSIPLRHAADTLVVLRETLNYSISMIEGHGCCWLTEEDEAEKDAHVARLQRLIGEIEVQLMLGSGS